MNKQQGFTLIEVMIVVVILGILAAVVVPRIMDRPDEARQMKAKTDIRMLQGQLELYRLDNFVYPTTDQGLEALVNKPEIAPIPPKWRSGGYIDQLPQDPWGREYLYLRPGQHGSIDIYTLGADGQPGGDGADADIGNWNLSRS